MKLDFVIFGGVGDLSLRKLLPSLYFLFRDGNMPRGSRIICASRGALSRDEFNELIELKLREFMGSHFDENVFADFFSHLSYFKIDLIHSPDWQQLSAELSLAAEPRNIIYYMSVPPTLFATVCEQLSAHHLNPTYSKVVVEKPLGEDYQSALSINQLLRKAFKEEQIYRIDHYLGKKAIQDIIKMRFENKALDNVWNKDHIEKIKITVSETVGVEGRIEFIDRAGILRDMVQNHLMQILSLLLMEMPEELNDEEIRDAKVAVINTLRPITETNVKFHTIKAQYSDGVVGGVTVPSYQEEITGKAEGCGETFVALKAFVDNQKWQDVPIYLKTGKRLSDRSAQIEVIFKEGNSQKITIEIQPNIEFRNLTDFTNLINEQALNEQTNARIPEAYENLIHQVIKGEQANFVRDDEILASWKWIDGIRDAWEKTNQKMIEYKAGSSGPELK
ncbi:MAG: glucose-6-phosphate dehydrogenase [Emcibacteraceae bacterium]|nr:glucose-6-phosphate dehydrogenase [Emcibacteraceae bacterium]